MNGAILASNTNNLAFKMTSLLDRTDPLWQRLLAARELDELCAAFSLDAALRIIGSQVAINRVVDANNIDGRIVATHLMKTALDFWHILDFDSGA